MFKSKFANALTTMMIGSLGIASAQNKLPLATARKRATWTRWWRKCAGRFCRDSLVITRNEESRTLLPNLVCRRNWEPTPLGPSSSAPDYGNEVLRKAGWDGVTPVICGVPD